MEHVYSIMPLAEDHFEERVADLIEKTPDILGRIKRILKKDKTNKDELINDVAEQAAEVIADLDNE